MMIDIDFDIMDKITIKNLYTTYEMLYKELVDAERGSYLHAEDRHRNEEILDAITTLATYYEISTVALDRLATIEREVNTANEVDHYEEMLKNMGVSSGE